MTNDQLDALRYYITAVTLFLTRDLRHKHGDLTDARLNLERAFGTTLEDKPSPFADIL